MQWIRQVFSGLRFRLLLLVVLTCSPLVALTLHTAWDERRRQETSWEQRLSRLAQAAVREDNDLISATRQLLLAVAESSAVRSGNRQAAQRLLSELLSIYPRYVNLGAVRTNGEVFATAQATRDPGNQGEQAYFRRVVDTGAFSVGDFPLPGQDRSSLLKFGHPVYDRSNRIFAVVFAALDLKGPDRFGSQITGQVPRFATWTEVDLTGRILNRYPNPESWIGRSLPNDELLKAAVSRTNGVVEISGPTGETQFFAFRTRSSPLTGSQVIDFLGTQKQMLFAGANRALTRNLTGLGTAFVLALVVGWFGSNLLIVRPVRALVRSSARLAKGDLTARTGLRHGRDELGRLMLAFDQMAKSLEEREAERQRAKDKLQVLSHRVVEVQESERRHIARELHDEIGQALTAAEMNLQAALQAPGTSALERRLEESIQAIEQVLEQVHDLSLNLRPSMLDDLGLEPALRWYAHRAANAAGLELDFHADPLEGRLEPVIETECFRIAQEALTNVARHSKARNVKVELTTRNGDLHLHVRDDGQGFDVANQRDQAVRGSSLGLLSMEERAALAGGGLRFNSCPGEGTEVHAWFPLRYVEPASHGDTEYGDAGEHG